MSLISRSNLKSLPGGDEPSGAPGAGGALTALLGPGSSFEGKLVFEGTVQVEGVFTGEIRSKDTLVIGKSGNRTEAFLYLCRLRELAPLLFGAVISFVMN